MYKVIITKTFDDQGALVSTEERLEVIGAVAPVSNEPAEAQVETAAPEQSEAAVVVPTVTLNGNKLELNEAAINALGAKTNDKICVQYKQFDGGVFVPVIGKEENMGQSLNGNKLTKLGTVSFRGKQREGLVRFGDVFELVATDEPGVMLMQGNAKVHDVTDEELEVSNEDTTKSSESLAVDDNAITFGFGFDMPEMPGLDLADDDLEDLMC